MLFQKPTAASQLSILKVVWSQNTCSQKCLSAGPLSQPSIQDGRPAVSFLAGFVEAELVSEGCRGRLQRRGENLAIMETQLRWEGRGFFHFFVYLRNKVIFSEGLTFPARQLGCVLQCCSVSATDLEASTQMEISYGKESSLCGFCFGGVFLTNSVRHSFSAASFLAHETDFPWCIFGKVQGALNSVQDLQNASGL